MLLVRSLWLLSRRHRVRLLPKESWGPDESPLVSASPPRKSSYVDILSFLHRKWTFSDLLHYWKDKHLAKIREDQKYLLERHSILGPDLAAAHFLAFRRGRVKFKGMSKWITDKEINEGEIPNRFVRGFHLEEIDISHTNICYEGLENMANLRELRKLSVRGCGLLDDWCLHRFHIFGHTLEHLDLSGCHLVTDRGIATLHTLKHLRRLVVRDMLGVQNLELVCLLLQDCLPQLRVEGPDYTNPTLSQRIAPYMDPA